MARSTRVANKSGSHTQNRTAKKKTVLRARVASAAKSVVSSRTKSVPVKKAIQRESVVRKTEALPHECFWVNNGPVVKDLAGLAQALQTMHDNQFAYHARAEQNDFARWVEDVFGEKALARKLARSRTREAAFRIVVAHVSLARA